MIVLCVLVEFEPTQYLVQRKFLRFYTDKAVLKKSFSREEIKKQLIHSLINSEKVETEDLNKQAHEVQKCKEATIIVEEYEDIIRTKKKNIISIAYQQRKVFRRFKEKQKFIVLVKEFKVHKSTMIFKINIVKLIDKYPKTKKSSVILGKL